VPQTAAPPPKVERPQPAERKPPQTQQGGMLAELPKPIQEERPDQARIVSRFDSKAQDVGPAESGARKPSGEKPPQLPPELALPERYSALRPTPPETPPSQPTPQALTAPSPAPPPPPPTPRMPEKPRRREAHEGNKPVPQGEQPTPQKPSQPAEQRFRITAEQEVAMLQQPQADQGRKQAMEEHFEKLEKNLPLPSFDAPGVYQQGPEQPGEGQDATGGGKYRSIDAFGLQHFSYLVGVKRKIELVFSVPYFTPHQGTVGVPIVGFTIRRDGVLAEAVLLHSSGYAVVDRALLDAVKRAAPYGPFPEHLPDGEISIRVYATLS